MTLTKEDDIKKQVDLLLPRRSLLIMEKEARYNWLHGIKFGKVHEFINNTNETIRIERNRRVSVSVLCEEASQQT